jgi:hypothetical protein
MALDQVLEKLSRGSGISLLLSDLHLPSLGQHLWAAASPLRADIGCHLPRRLVKSSTEWMRTTIQWNHALCVGVSTASGQLHPVTHAIDRWNSMTWYFPHLLQHILSSFMLVIAGGLPYKAPHKASCPPVPQAST